MNYDSSIGIIFGHCWRRNQSPAAVSGLGWAQASSCSILRKSVVSSGFGVLNQNELNRLTVPMQHSHNVQYNYYRSKGRAIENHDINRKAWSLPKKNDYSTEPISALSQTPTKVQPATSASKLSVKEHFKMIDILLVYNIES